MNRFTLFKLKKKQSHHSSFTQNAVQTHENNMNDISEGDMKPHRHILLFQTADKFITVNICFTAACITAATFIARLLSTMAAV